MFISEKMKSIGDIQFEGIGNQWYGYFDMVTFKRYVNWLQIESVPLRLSLLHLEVRRSFGMAFCFKLEKKNLKLKK